MSSARPQRSNTGARNARAGILLTAMPVEGRSPAGASARRRGRLRAETADTRLELKLRSVPGRGTRTWIGFVPAVEEIQNGSAYFVLVPVPQPLSPHRRIAPRTVGAACVWSAPAASAEAPALDEEATAGGAVSLSAGTGGEACVWSARAASVALPALKLEATAGGGVFLRMGAALACRWSPSALPPAVRTSMFTSVRFPQS